MKKNDAETLDLRLFFPYRLSVLQQRVSAAVPQHDHDEFDLSRLEWRVMATLAMFGSVSAREICEFTYMAKMQVSRAIARLKSTGLVARDTSPADHRASVLSLTPAGEALYRQIVPRVKAQEREILARLSATEQDQLLNILTKLETSLG
jgi:DNA-binding MarR family transcriptional regulator